MSRYSQVDLFRAREYGRASKNTWVPVWPPFRQLLLEFERWPALLVDGTFGA